MLPWWVLMADDYIRQGETFRAPEFASKKIPANMVITMIPTIVSGNLTYSVTTSSPITVPSGATHALLTVDIGGGDIRYWEDGSTPTTSAGLLVPAGGAAELTNLSNVRLISTPARPPSISRSGSTPRCGARCCNSGPFCFSLGVAVEH